MAPVSAQRNTAVYRILLRQPLNDVPGVIAAAVVYKQDTAVFPDQTGSNQFSNFSRKKRCRDRQHRLFVITGYYDV
jgi:hypothetical protein